MELGTADPKAEASREDAFDPDQPRDERGQWTGGGGGAAAKAAGRAAAGRGPQHELVKGEHFRDVRSRSRNFSEADQHAVLHHFDRPVVRAVLASLPPDRRPELTFRQRIGAKDLVAGQVITGQTRNGEIRLATDRPKTSYGKEFKPGAMQTVSEAGKTLHEAIAITGSHEVAHHLFDEGGRDLQNLVLNAVNDRGHRPVSNYATQGVHEYFAESFAAYQHDKAAFEKYDPKGAQLVRRALGIRGLHL